MFKNKKQCKVADLGEGAVVGGFFDIDFSNEPRKADD
jgi:hypothetical protein